MRRLCGLPGHRNKLLHIWRVGVLRKSLLNSNWIYSWLKHGYRKTNAFKNKWARACNRDRITTIIFPIKFSEGILSIVPKAWIGSWCGSQTCYIDDGSLSDCSPEIPAGTVPNFPRVCTRKRLHQQWGFRMYLSYCREEETEIIPCHQSNSRHQILKKETIIYLNPRWATR
jgi:hypothetical protein